MIRVVALIVTWRRERELDRLLASLENSTRPPDGCIIMDHAGSLDEAIARRSFPVKVFRDPSNPGPGAGWANAARHAVQEFGPSHRLYLDDDVVMRPDTLEILLRELGGAAAICPLLEDAGGRLWGFPEPADAGQRRAIRSASTPADALAALGPGPHAFRWATGACLLVDRRGGEAAGLHRPDFWMLGEDLEYSMRLAALGGVFTCLASVPHLPPVPNDAAQARAADYRKFCSLLQNLSYLSFHCPRSGHLWTYLPGNFRRFFRTHGAGRHAVGDALCCLWHGAVRGEPAGQESGARLRARIASRTPALT